MKKTILVTGGAGFIGSNLCERLLDDGHRVICVDSFFSGKKENIEKLLDNKNFILIKHNIIYPIKRQFEKIDEIYNLACPASPIQYQFDPILTTRTIVDGTRNMLDLARKYDAKLLQASTSEIYGDPLEHPQKETYFGNVDPLGKRSCYDEGKRVAESLCKDYNIQYGVDVRIVRLFNVYGPKMMFNDGRVMSNFILKSLLGEDIEIHGKGEQSRSFMYIDDLIDGFLKFMDAPEEKVGIGPVNLGNPDERTIKQLAEDIKQAVGGKSKITYIDYEKVPDRLGDPQRRCPDISKAKAMLDWEPKIKFDDGLNKTIADFKNRINNKTNIIIFAPNYLPLEGPAEKAVKELTDRMIAYDFDIIVARGNLNLDKSEKIGRINIYRVGLGNSLDKYWLPLLGSIKALRLNKKRNYQVAWGVMASYGSLAGVIFSLITKKALLLSLFEGKINNKKITKRLLQPFYRIIFHRAHHIQVIADLDDQQIAWAEDDKVIIPVDLDKGWDYVAKKTREEFQELEILTSRL